MDQNDSTPIDNPSTTVDMSLNNESSDLYELDIDTLKHRSTIFSLHPEREFYINLYVAMISMSVIFVSVFLIYILRWMFDFQWLLRWIYIDICRCVSLCILVTILFGVTSNILCVFSPPRIKKLLGNDIYVCCALSTFVYITTISYFFYTNWTTITLLFFSLYVYSMIQYMQCVKHIESDTELEEYIAVPIHYDYYETPDERRICVYVDRCGKEVRRFIT